MPILTRFAILTLASSLVASCGLIDPDIADFDLSLPRKDIVVDTSTWELTDEASLPSVDCSLDAQICSMGIAQLCGAEGVCTSSCSAEDTCDVTIGVSLWHSFDLAMEKPELEEIEGQPLVSITIKRIAYEVTENTMNVATPAMTVYVAAEGVMSPDDAGAEAIGVVPAVPAGTTVEVKDIELTATGRETLAGYMKEYSQPFNIIIGTDIDIHAGDVVPTGKLTAVVVVSAVAGI